MDNSFNDTFKSYGDYKRSATSLFKLIDSMEKKQLFLFFLFDRLELNRERIGYKF